MSILDNAAHDVFPHDHSDPSRQSPRPPGTGEHLDSTWDTERADTADFPVLSVETAVSDAVQQSTPDQDRDPAPAPVPSHETVPSADNHEEHSTLLIAALIPIGCLWLGITIDGLFDSSVLTATSVAVFATLTLGVLVASALHDSE